MKEWDWGTLIENLQPIEPPDAAAFEAATRAWNAEQEEFQARLRGDRRRFQSTLPELPDRSELRFDRGPPSNRPGSMEFLHGLIPAVQLAIYAEP